MPGDLLPDRLDELRYPLQFVIRIIMPGDDKGSDLDPDAKLPVEPDSVEHGLEPRTADLFVKFIVISFEIDIRRMKIRLDLPERLRSDVSVRYEYVSEPRLGSETRRIIGELEVNGGFRISIRDA